MKKFEKDWADLFEWITEVMVEDEIVPTKKGYPFTGSLKQEIYYERGKSSLFFYYR